MPLTGYLGDDRYYGYTGSRSPTFAAGGNSGSANLGYAAAVASGRGAQHSKQDTPSPQPDAPSGPQSVGTANTPQQITGQLNGQSTQQAGGDQSAQQIANYYANSYAYEPSTRAPRTDAPGPSGGSLPFIGTVGPDGVNSSTAPEILEARQASLNAATPNGPPAGAVPIPGQPGMYVTASGASWGQRQNPNYDQWVQQGQAALRQDTPEVRTYLDFLRSRGLPLGYGNQATERGYLQSYA
jgi:hypothetical protein